MKNLSQMVFSLDWLLQGTADLSAVFRAVFSLARRFTDRFERCLQRQLRCVCGFVAPAKAHASVLIVMHWAEGFRGTNTGRLVPFALENGEVWRRGHPDAHGAQLHLRRDELPAVVLYPSEDAVSLEDWVKENGVPRTIIVPDGTWGQAVKIVRREPQLESLPRVFVGMGTEAARYRLRRSPRAGKFGTAEAVIGALHAIGDSASAGRLDVVFSAMVEGTLAARASYHSKA